MSTSDKLTYLNGTKQALKESINNIGGDITSETTFREYATELDNIYNNIPKTTDTGTNLSLNTIKGKMEIIPKGDTSQNGTPTPDTPIDIEVVTGTQEVKVENVNLLNYNAFVKGRINSTTGQIEYAENTTNITTTDTTISFTTSQAWNSGITSDYIPIEQGSYTYSIKNATLKASVYIDLYDKDKNYLTRQGNKVINASEVTTWTTTISNTSAKYIRLHYEMGYADTITLTETQLQKGSTATSYTPHQEQTQIVSLGDIELCKIGNYQDYLYKSGDKWYKKARTIEQVITSNYLDNLYLFTLQSINSYGIANFLLQNISNTEESLYDYTGLCNYLSTQNSSIATEQNEGILYQPRAVYVRIKSTTASTTTELKTYVDSLNTSGNPLKIYRPLATANDIEITDTNLKEQLNNLEKLMSYNGTTNISSSGNLPFIISASALKGES